MIIDGTQVCSPMTNADDTKLDIRTRIMLFILCLFRGHLQTDFVIMTTLICLQVCKVKLAAFLSIQFSVL